MTPSRAAPAVAASRSDAALPLRSRRRVRKVRPVRIANASGFYGDRVSAAAELVAGGPLDVLTGDWLAELTMLILARSRLKRGPGGGYARTFLAQLDDVLDACLARDIRIVSNAGGVDPAGLAAAVQELAVRHKAKPRVAYVTGDDLVPRFDQLSSSGEAWVNLDTGERFATTGQAPLTANAYLGAFAIRDALAAGADIVVTGRVTDASLVVGPGAWFHGWGPTDLDALAGATVAGHLVECGTQVTGGNYAFFDDVPGMEHLGFPVVELAADGSCVVTKQPGTGGLVSRGTVTAQLLYEVDGPRYLGPDVVTRFDTVQLVDDGPDRVRVTGARGEPPPDRLKVALNYLAGERTTVTFVLTGADPQRKAAVVLEQLFAAVPGGREAFDDVDVQLLPHAGDPLPLHERPADVRGVGTVDTVSTLGRSEWAAQAELRVTVTSRDPDLVGRAFTARAVELTLASVPGLFLPGPPPASRPLGVYWPTTVAAAAVTPEVWLVEPTLATGSSPPAVRVPPVASHSEPTGTPAEADSGEHRSAPAMVPDGPTCRVPLGRLVGARSGDKGGTANIGLWVRHDAPDVDGGYAWLLATVTPQRLPDLLPEAAGLDVAVHRFDNLRAVNVVVRGLLGRGVAENTSVDPQGKGLGEYLRSRVVDVPEALLLSNDRSDREAR